MEQVRSYIISIAAAAIIYAAVMMLVEKKTSFHKVTRLICGIFMTVTVIAPFMSLKMDRINWNSISYLNKGKIIADQANMETMNAISSGIIAQTESYILNKARLLDSNITADVTVSDDNLMIPSSVILSGQISPYAKQILSDYITHELGISKENQVWK